MEENVQNDVQNANLEVKKKGNKTLLIVIGIILVLLIGFGVFYFINREKSKNIYFEIIDSLSEKLKEPLEKVENKKLGYKADVDFDLKSDDVTLKKVANIINETKLSLNLESDRDKKIANMNLNLNYKNKGDIKADLVLNNDSVYADLNELYDKPIKLVQNDVIKDLWQTKDNSDYEVIVTEISKELKNSLKEEYFTKTKETIEVMGKKVKTVRHRLELDTDKFVELNNNLIENIKNNSKLIEALVNVSNTDRDKVISALDDLKMDRDGLEDVTILSDIYVSGYNNIERMNLSVKNSSEEFDVTFNKIAKEKYEIIVNNDNIGSLEINDNKMALNINYEDLKIVLEYSDEKDNIKFKVSVTDGDDVLAIDSSEKADKGNMTITINSKTFKIDLKVNVAFEEKEIKNITEKDVSKAVDVDAISEKDYSTILENIQKNKAISELFTNLLEL